MVVIAFSGKGGTGKTTLSALAVKYFTEENQVTLAFDMDPDAHLYKLLGLSIGNTIGQIVDRLHKEKQFELEPKKPPEVADVDYFYRNHPFYLSHQYKQYPYQQEQGHRLQASTGLHQIHHEQQLQ
jgi:CO dehydrogenase nickel-insertion accessory protein CooC1